MKIYNQLEAWQTFRRNLPAHTSLGFVPTMGNLHAGHASLFSNSLAENDYTVGSIFINPTQFNQQEDYLNYPITLKQDLELLQGLGVDFCLLPEKSELYEDGYRYQITETLQSMTLEGAHRPGHFNGVLTVVMKLFNLVKPTRAYFGEKDYQQFVLIRDMIKAFCMDIDVKACPTIREKSGLACSSRNSRLTDAQRPLAERFAQIFHQPLKLEAIKKELNEQNIAVEYVEEQDGRRFAAVSIGDIRLIDNYLITED